jgi:hypothetical protein
MDCAGFEVEAIKGAEASCEAVREVFKFVGGADGICRKTQRALENS